MNGSTNFNWKVDYECGTQLKLHDGVIKKLFSLGRKWKENEMQKRGVREMASNLRRPSQMESDKHGAGGCQISRVGFAL